MREVLLEAHGAGRVDLVVSGRVEDRLTQAPADEWGARQVVVIRPDGSEVEAVTDPSVRACCPAWRPAR